MQAGLLSNGSRPKGHGTHNEQKTSLVAQRSLKVAVVVSEDYWLQSNVFHIR